MFRNKIFIILIILLLIAIILAGLFWYLSSQKQKQILNQNFVNYQPPANNLNVNQNTNLQPKPKITRPPKVSEEEKLKAQLTKMASAFTERYGSYSNQSDFENLEDLMTFMSKSLEHRTENFIREKRAQANQAAIYYGITTKSLKTEILDFSPEIGQAKFKVSTQRQEIVGSSVNAKVFYQDVEIKMIKEGGVWVVDQIEWR